jgi:hypothetical protein
MPLGTSAGQQHVGPVITTSLQLDEVSVMHTADDRVFGKKLLQSMLAFFKRNHLDSN